MVDVRLVLSVLEVGLLHHDAIFCVTWVWLAALGVLPTNLTPGLLFLGPFPF